jgi:hypothetical protein
MNGSAEKSPPPAIPGTSAVMLEDKPLKKKMDRFGKSYLIS